MHLTFTHLRKNYDCYDNDTRLSIYDGETMNDPEIISICDTEIPPKIMSNGNALHIKTTAAVSFSLSYSVFSSGWLNFQNS